MHPGLRDSTCIKYEYADVQKGPQDGCDCTAVADCPDEEHAVGCSACGGADSNGQCNGVSNLSRRKG